MTIGRERQASCPQLCWVRLSQLRTQSYVAGVVREGVDRM